MIAALRRAAAYTGRLIEAAVNARTLARTVRILSRQLDNAHLLAASEEARADRAEAALATARANITELARLHREAVALCCAARERVAELEPKVREFCIQCLDPFIGEEDFDFIAHLGAQVPMKTISMLLGIPETDQEGIRDRLDRRMRLGDGDAPPRLRADDPFAFGSDGFAAYAWTDGETLRDLKAQNLHFDGTLGVTPFFADGFESAPATPSAEDFS